MDLLHRIDPISGIYLNSSYQVGSPYIQSNWTLIEKELPNPNIFNVTKWDFELLKWVEGMTQAELDVIADNFKIQEIKDKYEIHKANGWEAYNTFRARVVLDIEKGLITEPQAFVIESNLNVAFDQISATGDWKTARYKLTQVVPLPEYVEPYYDLAMQIINDYIANNYDY